MSQDSITNALYISWTGKRKLHSPETTRFDMKETDLHEACTWTYEECLIINELRIERLVLQNPIHCGAKEIYENLVEIFSCLALSYVTVRRWTCPLNRVDNPQKTLERLIDLKSVEEITHLTIRTKEIADAAINTEIKKGNKKAEGFFLARECTKPYNLSAEQAIAVVGFQEFVQPRHVF